MSSTCRKCGRDFTPAVQIAEMCPGCRDARSFNFLNRQSPEHGTRGYRRGCRCEVCRTAVAAYRRERRRQRGCTNETSYDKVCQCCGGSYVAVKKSSRYCSDKCKAWGRCGYTMSPCRDLVVWQAPPRKRRLSKPKPPKTRFFGNICLKCDRFFWSEWQPHKWCSPTCRGKTKNRAKNRMRQELDNAVRMYIYRRDGWVCQLCFGDIDPELPSSDAWGATLDHIVPQSHGGSHHPLNLRAAHMYCNAVRGNRTGDFSSMLVQNIVGI